MSNQNESPPQNGASVVVVTTPQLQNPQVEKSETSLHDERLLQVGQVLESNRELTERYQTLTERLEMVESQSRSYQSETQAALSRILALAEAESEEAETESEELEIIQPEPEPETETPSEPEPQRTPPKWARLLFGE